MNVLGNRLAAPERRFGTISATGSGLRIEWIVHIKVGGKTPESPHQRCQNAGCRHRGCRAGFRVEMADRLLKNVPTQMPLASASNPLS